MAAEISTRTLLDAHQAYMARWKASGGKTAEYTCPACYETIERSLPSGRGETWHSAVTCPHCEQLHMVVVRRYSPIEATLLMEAIHG